MPADGAPWPCSDPAAAQRAPGREWETVLGQGLHSQQQKKMLLNENYLQQTELEADSAGN